MLFFGIILRKVHSSMACWTQTQDILWDVNIEFKLALLAHGY